MVDYFMPSLIHSKVDSIQNKQTNVHTTKNEVNTEIFKCGQCLETFRTLVAKKKHEKFYHFFSKPFVCECGQQFGKLCEVNYHVRRVHNKEKNYVCNICKKAFFKNSDLVIHQNVHEQSAKFICEDCGRRFKHVSNLIRHTRIHTGIKPYLCLPCNKRFSQVAALRQHETTEKHKETLNEKNKQNNENCNAINDQEKFSSNSQLGGAEKWNSSPLKTDSGKRRWWFYCKICGERFPFSVLLRDHETKHAVNKDIKCNSCKAEFSHVREFNNHACVKSKKVETQLPKKISEKHKTQVKQTVEKPLDASCVMNENEETFNDKDRKIELTLTQSGQIMLDNDEVLLTLNDKIYGLLLINNDVTILENDDYLQILNPGKSEDARDLEEIESVFNVENLHSDLTAGDDSISHLVLPDNWQWMEKSLSEEEKYIEESMNKCDDLTIEKKNFNENSTKKGENLSKRQEHKCQECKKNFSWSSSLRNHRLRMHTKKTEYSCSRCNKTYCSSLLVEHHIKRDHLNMRSYKCTICEKAFFRRYDLKVHIRIHTDERPYICGVCGKRFRHLSHSIRHDRTHLKDSTSRRKSMNGS